MQTAPLDCTGSIFKRVKLTVRVNEASNIVDCAYMQRMFRNVISQLRCNPYPELCALFVLEALRRRGEEVGRKSVHVAHDAVTSLRHPVHPYHRYTSGLRTRHPCHWLTCNIQSKHPYYWNTSGLRTRHPYHWLTCNIQLKHPYYRNTSDLRTRFLYVLCTCHWL